MPTRCVHICPRCETRNESPDMPSDDWGIGLVLPGLVQALKHDPPCAACQGQDAQVMAAIKASHAGKPS
jgi:hypothetical protein